ncbi:MAG: pseudaminic acid cytidylyltransferase [Desulfobacteraceae bacterium]|nr:MAG: pseudaminic acid cytidylyltransferase [Desulfobacteraceae bacterium]
MNIAIIPARGGSKRIPDKNIRLFAGKPIIYYSIKAAQETGIFNQIIVSTDSEVIAETARRFGATVPFMRPKELSDDHTPTAPVIMHALEFLKNTNQPADYACCIYPTAPFILPKYLKEGYDLLVKHQVTSVFSITTFPFSIFRALKITEKGTVEMFWPEYEKTRSQDLPAAYHDAGQFYWMNNDRFMRIKKLYSPDAMPVVIPRYLVQDIDTPEDWETAERMFQAQFRKTG